MSGNKVWWCGSKDVEPFMPPVASAISRHIEKDEAWTDIYNRAYEAIYNALTAKPENEPLTLDELKQMNGEPMYEENENFVQTKFGYCFYFLGPCPFIYNLYVHPQYRRCGYSRMLLEFAINEIRKSGYESEIRIQAKPKEGSIELVDLMMYYKSMGLVIYEAHDE